MKLSILSKKKEIFNGYVKTLSSFNDVGPFDILSGHANFISLINTAVIINENLADEKTINLEKGILRVEKDKVDVFI